MQASQPDIHVAAFRMEEEVFIGFATSLLVPVHEPTLALDRESPGGRRTTRV
jgi:hypothetical protein